MLLCCWVFGFNLLTNSDSLISHEVLEGTCFSIALATDAGTMEEHAALNNLYI